MKKVAVLLFLCLNALFVLAQTAIPQPETWEINFYSKPEYALPLLIESALKHSAALEALELDKSIAQEDIQIAKKNILNSVSVGANYNYGNLGNFSTADGNQVTLRTSLMSRYSTGVNLSVPLDRIFSRQNQINRQELLYKQAESVRKNREDEIRQQIIRLYQEIVLARNLLNTYQENRQTASLNNQLAEKQFKKGEITLAEFSRINEVYNRAIIELENLNTKYKTDFWLLEEAIGTKISALMTNTTK